MNKILIVDASASDCRVMSSLLSKAGYDPIGVESIEASRRGYRYGYAFVGWNRKRVNQLVKDGRL